MAVTGVYPLTIRCVSVKVKAVFIICAVSASSSALLLLSKLSVGKQAESTSCTTSLTALSETWPQEMLPKYILHMRCHVMLREWTARAGLDAETLHSFIDQSLSIEALLYVVYIE